jgi:hypothetical protein
MQSQHEFEKRADRHREEALKKLDALQQEQGKQPAAEEGEQLLASRKAAGN